MTESINGSITEESQVGCPTQVLFNAFSAPITEKLLADTLVVGPLSCMKRCKDNTQCEVKKLYSQLCIDFQ